MAALLPSEGGPRMVVNNFMATELHMKSSFHRLPQFCIPGTFSRAMIGPRASLQARDEPVLARI